MQTLGLFLMQQLLDWCTQPLGVFSLLLQISDLKASYNSQVPPRWSRCPSLKTRALPKGLLEVWATSFYLRIPVNLKTEQKEKPTKKAKRVTKIEGHF